MNYQSSDMPVCINEEDNVRIPMVSYQMVVNAKGLDMLQRIFIL